MEYRNPNSWGFWSSSANVLLLVLLAMNLPLNVSAARFFRNETDRLALLEFKHQISDDPHGVLNSWNHSQHHCQWQGVTCSARHQRVTGLILPGKSLSGIISPHIGNISFMKFIHLGENQYHGKIPQEVSRLFRLRFLNLASNKLNEEIPVNISHSSHLITICLAENKLEGKIPIELTNLKKLEALYLSRSNLIGEIPSSIGNLSLLKKISIGFNNLEGNLPKEIGLLTHLTVLGVSANKLSGVIPPSIYNISALVNFSVPQNFFHGNLPTNIGFTLPNLQLLLIGGNNFHGNIPISITNASMLEVLDLPGNKFEGQVPTSLGNLRNLKKLNVEWNLLGNSSTRDLGFIASLTNCSDLEFVSLTENNFGGEIPKIIANLSYKLTQLYIGGNQLSGSIPKGFGNFLNLFGFELALNLLSGSIPSDFGKLKKLQYLGLGANKLSGEIPSTLCNATALYYLSLSDNRFKGSNIFDNVLVNCQNLLVLDLYQNNLSGAIPSHFFEMHPMLVNLTLGQNLFNGSLPLEVGKLLHMVFFDVSYNKFSGEIPPSLGDCVDLEILYMQANSFQGMIPPNMVSLEWIKELDLSSNDLIGQIPRDLERLQFLMYLNLSYNDLDGQIPNTGIFGKASQISLIGNRKLCGGIPELYLPSCPVIKGNAKRKVKVIIILCTVLPVIALVLGTLYSLMCRKSYRRKIDSPTEHTRVDKLLRVSYHELHRATNGFSSENLIGSGSFGIVYKGRLDQHGDRLVAVKVLDFQKNGTSKSFKVECRALKNIRHRNLVYVLSYCSSMDSKGHEFKALVYDFMENGNLDLWLHPEQKDETTKSRNLNLFQRLSIAIDVASALHYLHSHCETTVIHCDLKPSSILLDKDFVAHVGDFGIARLLPKTFHTSSEQGTSSSIAFKGSIGYAAPEYGMGLQVSTQGDVYSYGILLLEMFTAKRPTDDMFMDGFDLHNYVKSVLPEQVRMIVDPLLLSNGDDSGEVSENDEFQMEVTAQVELNNDEKIMQCLGSILKIGIKCSAALPNDRMPMNQMVRKLHLIKDAILGARINIADLDI